MQKNKQELKELLPLTSDIVFKRVFAREGNEDILKSLLEAILNIKIQKVEVKNPETGGKLEKWLWLITGEGEKLKMDEKIDKEIQKAIEVIEELSMNEKEWELYQSRMYAISDYNTGIAIATQKGIKERRNKRSKRKCYKNSKRNVKRKCAIRNDYKIYKINKKRDRKIKKLEKFLIYT